MKKTNKHINISLSLPFEQNVNVSYFYINLTDLNFYKFSNVKTIWNLKNLSKILHSVVLRKNFFLNFSIFKKIEKFIIFSNSSKNCIDKASKNNYFFLKFILFYNFSNFNYFAFLKRKKSIDWKLFTITLVQSITHNKMLFFYPILILESKKIKLIEKVLKNPSEITSITKKWLFRSIPRKKIFQKVSELSFLNVTFPFITITPLTIFLKKFISLFFLFKKKFIIPFLLKFFYQNSYYYYLIFILLILLKLNFYILNSLIIKIKLFYFEENFYNTNYCSHIKIYSTNERFTKSHILNNNFKWFFYIFQGLRIHQIPKFFFNLSELYFKIFEVFNVDYFYIDRQNNPLLKWFVINNGLNLDRLNFFSFKRIPFLEINHKIKNFFFICQAFQKFFFYFTDRKFNLIKIYNDFYTLSIKINYMTLFNKYTWLDSVSSLLSNYLFSEPTNYNLKFFFRKVYTRCFFRILNETKLLWKFEILFFKKKFLFWSRNIINYFYSSALWTAENSLNFFLFKVWKYYFFCLKQTAWFNHKFFIEELFHLSYEYRHADYERIQEYVRLKQLAELRLVKLTNFLKWMRQLKKDPGNIQYSPDFTQQHEFALTLKWGLELEALRFTKVILMRRFFGNIFNIKKNNFIKKKINFLFKFSQLYNNKDLSNKKNNKLDPNNLKLKEVYELIRLQLTSIVSSYWNIFKFKLNQLESFHFNFSLWSETALTDLYKFIFLSFDRYFLIRTYYKYYKNRNIRKKIRLSKLSQKKNFNWFFSSSSIFSDLLLLKGLNFYFLFWIFKTLKKKIAKIAKTKIFYQALLNLTTKNFKTFTLPSNLTLLDKNFYYFDLSNLTNTWTNKFDSILVTKLLIPSVHFYNNSTINIFLYLNIKKYLIKYLRDIYNLDFLNISVKNDNCSFYDYLLFSKFPLKDYELFCQKSFINYFSEYVYDIFHVFLNNSSLNLKFSSLNNHTQNNLFCDNLSNTFSKTFYNDLDHKNIFYQNFDNLNFFRLFMSKFSIHLSSKNNLNFLIKKFKLFLTLNIGTTSNFFKSKNDFRIFFVNNLLNALSKNLRTFEFLNPFITSVVNNLVYRFLKFINNDTMKFFLKKLHFDKLWLKNFTSQLKLVILNFYFLFLKLFIKAF